jgi:hypothetical protein
LSGLGLLFLVRGQPMFQDRGRPKSGGPDRVLFCDEINVVVSYHLPAMHLRGDAWPFRPTRRTGG